MKQQRMKNDMSMTVKYIEEGKPEGFDERMLFVNKKADQLVTILYKKYLPQIHNLPLEEIQKLAEQMMNELDEGIIALGDNFYTQDDMYYIAKIALVTTFRDVLKFNIFNSFGKGLI